MNARVKLLALTAFFIQGCVLVDSRLDVSHSSASESGPLADIESLTFAPPVIVDAREDVLRIGYKMNADGIRTANILTANSIEQIVSDAITFNLERSGHTVSEDGRILAHVSIERFWLDTDMHSDPFFIQFVGTVRCSISFVDRNSGKEIYRDIFYGSEHEKKLLAWTGTWKKVMSRSVDKFAASIVTNAELAKALRQASVQKQAH